MFEQTFVACAGRRQNRWSLAVSFTAQSALVAAMVTASMIHTGVLPQVFPKIVTIGPGRKPVPAGGLERRASAPGIVTRPPTKGFVLPTPKVEQTGTIISDSPPDPGRVGIADGPAGGGGHGFGDIGGDSLFANTAPPPRPIPQIIEAKKPPAAHAGPVRVSIGVQAARLIRQIKPQYPPLARAARISGTVRLEAIIARNGTIENLKVVSGHPMLTNAAVEAVRQWLYEPTMLNGEPVEVLTQIDVKFMLGQ